MRNEMRRRLSRLSAGAACCFATLILSGQAPATNAALYPNEFLQKYAGFDRSDLADVARGEAVAKSLDADSSEVAICASVRVAVPVSFYVGRFREIESFKRSENVLQVGRFSSPPSVGDLVGLTLEPKDVSDLKTCRPGQCGVKLDEAGIERLAAATRGSIPGAVADGAFREHLAEYARQYMERGNPVTFQRSSRIWLPRL
jgi:hypothetical protein